MIGGIRRRFAKSTEKDTWNTEREFEDGADDASELPTDTAVLLAATQAAPGFSPGEWSLTDYYKSIVETALRNGGKYGGHQISMPWLRMISAGLEGRHIEPEVMWYATEPDAPTQMSPTIPSYDNLFPSDRVALANPR